MIRRVGGTHERIIGRGTKTVSERGLSGLSLGGLAGRATEPPERKHP